MIKTGVDIVEISRFIKMKNISSFLAKYFTDYECNYINSKLNKFQTLAGLYSAKESFLKCFGLGIGDIELKKISILHDSHGKPFLEINQMLTDLLHSNNCTSVDISISHSESYAISVCVAN